MRNKKIIITVLCFALLCFRATGCADKKNVAYADSIGIEFMLIPAGSFVMGTNRNGLDVRPAENPQHEVTISKPFYLGKYEVTQAQWEAVMGNNPSKFRGRNHPVEQISWNDTQEFIKRLNAKEGHNRYRLPTEAEWEYAVRAGSVGDSVYFFGDGTKPGEYAYHPSDLARRPATKEEWEEMARSGRSFSAQVYEKNELTEYAWYWFNSGEKHHPVGQKLANPWGLHDVYGNVNEWVQDWYEEKYYAGSPQVDPQGPANGDYRSLRGGDWDSRDENCSTSGRGGFPPSYRLDIVGFRLALSLE